MAHETDGCSRFELDEEQEAKLAEWLEEHDKKCPFSDPRKQGPIGGRLTYSFTPTGMGIAAKVKCACHDTHGREDGLVDLSDYENW